MRIKYTTTVLDDNMKTTPTEDKIRARMAPGVLTLNGFLGDDKRSINEIIADDEYTLNQLGISAEELAERMEFFQSKSFDSFDGSITIEGVFDVETEVVRGYLPCPFMHSGIYRKSFTIVTNKATGKSVRYSALNIHLIKAHHFFEGKNSHFRLEPTDLINTLWNK